MCESTSGFEVIPPFKKAHIPESP